MTYLEALSELVALRFFPYLKNLHFFLPIHVRKGTYLYAHAMYIYAIFYYV